MEGGAGEKRGDTGFRLKTTGSYGETRARGKEMWGSDDPQNRQDSVGGQARRGAVGALPIQPLLQRPVRAHCARGRAAQRAGTEPSNETGRDVKTGQLAGGAAPEKQKPQPRLCSAHGPQEGG